MKSRFVKTKALKEFARDKEKQISKKALEAFDLFVYNKLLKLVSITRGHGRITEKEVEVL